MPKIDIYEKPFFALLGKTLDQVELARKLTAAKAELDEYNQEEALFKIELNDTNRPDLWSTAGLARELNKIAGKKYQDYKFLASRQKAPDCGQRQVVVQAELRGIRPFIAAFVARGRTIDEPLLKDIIQTQEKLCWNYGQKRKSIAMGVYREEMIRYPVHYKAADPKRTAFVPLGMTEKLNLIQILEQHPKGQEFGAIVKDFPAFPFLTDKNDEVLSFPPVINSARLGAVEVGDNAVFVELTGTDINSLLLVCTIAACDLADNGFAINPVKICYPYDTPYGREIVTPYYFQTPVTVSPQDVKRLLGEELDLKEINSLLTSIGHSTELKTDGVAVRPHPYRNDFLHPVDVVEELIIARGIDSFQPEMPREFTIGRLSESEIFARKVRDTLVGLGFQEMIYNYLGSREDFIERMKLSDEGFIEIQNPMTENYAVVRRSILANLLGSEAVSGNAVYPHAIFEIGKVAFKDDSDNYGCVTRDYLGFLYAQSEAGFNEINSRVSALFYYLVSSHTLKELDHPSFIRGRSAEIWVREKQIGIMGEIHPEVLANWGIGVPCACAEIDLTLLRD